jgi:hypothetical protein
MASKERKTIKPRPTTTREALNASIPEVTPGTKPELPSVMLRAEQVSVKGDKFKDYSIDFKDIDEAVLFYFDTVIKPSVMEDGSRVKVPVIYANPERWKSAQADGGIRDKDGKILFPVVVVKKDSIDKVRDISSKVDGNKAQNYHIFQQGYTKVNQYDNFSALNNRKPAKAYSMVIVPDYYKITYSCAVYVNQVDDLNKIVEAILYASDSYWGDSKRFTFMARIDSVPITQEVNQGENRKIYSVFNITLNGHVIPDSINKHMSASNKFYSKSQVVFNTEVVYGSRNKARVSKVVRDGFVSFPERILTNDSRNMSAEVASYLGNNKSKMVSSGDIYSDRFYLRNAYILQAPPTLPPTTKENYYIYVNGQLVYDEEVVSVAQVGDDILFIVDVANVGYSLKTTFEIEVIGKFV